jgi:hypothetical protein
VPSSPLPAPLPPGQRTVGQFIAETIRAYGQRFWGALPLGVPIALVDQLSVREDAAIQVAVYWAATPLFVAAYLWACRLIYDRRPTVTAAALATLIYLPFPILRAFYILPGIAWFAFIGLAVPTALIEGTGFRASLVRGRQLGTADFVHALGSLAALVVVIGVAGETLSALLHSQGSSGLRGGLFLSDMVLGPLLFIGGAQLYGDQVARIGSRRSDRKRAPDADLHPPVDLDAAGRADPQVEP